MNVYDTVTLQGFQKLPQINLITLEFGYPLITQVPLIRTLTLSFTPTLTSWLSHIPFHYHHPMTYIYSQPDMT